MAPSFSEVPNICESSARNKLHNTLLAPSSLSSLINSWNMYAPLLYYALCYVMLHSRENYRDYSLGYWFIERFFLKWTGPECTKLENDEWEGREMKRPCLLHGSYFDWRGITCSTLTRFVSGPGYELRSPPHQRLWSRPGIVRPRRTYVLEQYEQVSGNILGLL